MINIIFHFQGELKATGNDKKTSSISMKEKQLPHIKLTVNK